LAVITVRLFDYLLALLLLGDSFRNNDLKKSGDAIHGHFFALARLTHLGPGMGRESRGEKKTWDECF